MRLADVEKIGLTDMEIVMCDESYKKALEMLWDKILNAPTVLMPIDVVKHGVWIKEPNCWYRCSNCGSHYPSIRGYMDYNYCPSCGARMNAERKEL